MLLPFAWLNFVTNDLTEAVQGTTLQFLIDAQHEGNFSSPCEDHSPAQETIPCAGSLARLLCLFLFSIFDFTKTSRSDVPAIPTEFFVNHAG